MKLTTAILALGLGLGSAWAQNPDVIGDTRNTLQNVQKKQTIDQNAVLAASGQGQSSTPASSPAAAPAPSTAAQSTPVAASVSPTAAKQGKTPVVSATPAKAAKTTAAKGKKKSTVIAVNPPAEAQQKVAVEDKKVPVEPKKNDETKNYSANGRRDPFISPVVNRTMTGSGCSTGKRCLAIDQINLQGIVKSDAGMIAVVVNALNKAYFLRENDPVFNGYVVKITGDSIIFKETIQDKMGKPFEREVTKRISTPAV
jgi:Tfp pilus assembly protein PilP